VCRHQCLGLICTRVLVAQCTAAEVGPAIDRWRTLATGAVTAQPAAAPRALVAALGAAFVPATYPLYGAERAVHAACEAVAVAACNADSAEGVSLASLERGVDGADMFTAVVSVSEALARFDSLEDAAMGVGMRGHIEY
jgi:hypothetical protein